MSERYTYLTVSKKLRYRILRRYDNQEKCCPPFVLWQSKKIVILQLFVKESHMAQNQLISGLTALGLSKQDILSLINKRCVECENIK